MELIIIRHGETDANAKGALLGWTDAALNECGIEQAKTASKKLRELKITNINTIFSSPLKRAAQTAEIISNELGHKNIIYSENLKERNFGNWDGLTIDEIKQLHENEYRLWMEDINYCMKNGEEVCNINKRVKVFLEDITNIPNTWNISNESFQTLQKVTKVGKETKAAKTFDEVAETTYIIVTHLGCIRYMIPFLLGMPDEYSWRFRVDNGSLVRICINQDRYAYLKM